VLLLPAGDLAAAVSVWEQATIQASAENVWCHERVLRALMEQCAVLPMRFGTIVDDPNRLLSRLADQSEKLLKDLQRLDGKVEMALRILDNCSETRAVLPPEPARDPNGGPGASYLRARMQNLYGTEAVRHSVGAVKRTIRDRLDPLSAEAVWDLDVAPVLPIKASYLVSRDGVTDFVETVDAIAHGNPDILITCTGPWAPYSFVGTTMTVAGDL